jgi:hypothetical protein
MTPWTFSLETAGGIGRSALSHLWRRGAPSGKLNVKCNKGSVERLL